MDLSRVDLSLYYIKNRNVTMTYVIMSLLGSRDHDILRLMERGEVKWKGGRERVKREVVGKEEREGEGGRGIVCTITTSKPVGVSSLHQELSSS